MTNRTFNRALLLSCLIGILVGCSNTPSPSPKVGDVATPDGVVYGQELRVQIPGSALRDKVSATLTDGSKANACGRFTLTTNSDSLLEYTCKNLDKEGDLTLTITRIDGVVLKRQTLKTTTSAITVSTIAVVEQTNLIADQVNTIRITGTNLSAKTPLTITVDEEDPASPDIGVVTVNACNPLTVAKQSATEIDYACTPVKLGTAKAVVKLNEQVLKEQSFTVTDSTELTTLTITPTQVVSGGTIDIRLTGKNLSNAITLTALTTDDKAAACDPLTLVTGSATATQRLYTCGVKATEPFVLKASVRDVSREQSVSPVNNFTVTSIELAPNALVLAGKSTRFVMTGTGLSKLLLPTSSECATVVYVSGDATKTEFDCTNITPTSQKLTLAMRANNADVYSKEFVLSLTGQDIVSSLNYYGLTYGSNSAVKITSSLLETGTYAAEDSLTMELEGCKTKVAPLIYTHPAKYERVYKCDQITATDTVNVALKNKAGQVVYQGDVDINARTAKDIPATEKTATVSSAGYSKGLITIDGSGLDQPIDLALTGCLSLDVAKRTPTQILARCARFTALGAQTLTVKSKIATLKTQSLTIPAPQVTLTISQDDNSAVQDRTVVMEMEVLKAPISAQNILYYVWTKAYKDIIFHRVVNTGSFNIVQGGGVLKNGSTERPGVFPPVKLERTNITGLSNSLGSVGLARAGEDSATTQFYFNTLDNSGVFNQTATTPGFAVFARVITGLSLLQLLDDAPKTGERPNKDINLVSIEQTQ